MRLLGRDQVTAEDIVFGLAELMLKQMGMFAHGEGIGNLILSAGMVALVIAIPLVLAVIFWMLRDMFRFGRERFPWWVGAIAGTLFGAAGFWAAGPAGVSIGAPLVIAFGLGRWRAGRKEKN